MGKGRFHSLPAQAVVFVYVFWVVGEDEGGQRPSRSSGRRTAFTRHGSKNGQRVWAKYLPKPRPWEKT